MKEPLIFTKYKEATVPLLKLSLPHLTENEIEKAVNYSMVNRFKDTEECRLDNNYKEQTVNLSLSEITDYIISREPIITSYGVLFNKHSVAPNPLGVMTMGFLDQRSKAKKEMFKYPKGSEMYEKYNLSQSLLKIDANGTYGALGQHTCLFYNLYVSSSITTQGRSLISAASLQFEMFLNNNCKFNSLNEVVTFIGNVISEKPNRRFNDNEILDRDITVEECFNKLILTCGFDYIPSNEDMEVIWNMLLNLDIENINRIYYKNNLFSFMDNPSMNKALIYILQELDAPYVDPNNPPINIKPELDALCDLLMEYVYYSHQIIDRLAKYDNMYRSVSVITDTDSSIISLDGWYNYALNKCMGIPMKIKEQEVDAISYIDALNGDDISEENPIEEVTVNEYSFYDEDIVEVKRSIDPTKIIAQDGLRYSIINILAYCLDKVANDYMIKYTENSFSASPDRKCLMILKNEFLFRRVLLTTAKKNYASIQELQEGITIDEDESLDVKGLPMNKSTLNTGTQKRLKKILYEDILNTPAIDQIRVLKSIASFEKDIYDSLQSGDKTYYKPARIKGLASYEDPMRIQGIKAAIVYNAVREDYMEIIDLNEINSIDIIKVNINPKTIECIKDNYPVIYDKLKTLLSQKEFKGNITGLAMPLDVETPEWVLNFINYNTIISDNIVFPLASLGIHEGKSNYTNIVRV